MKRKYIVNGLIVVAAAVLCGVTCSSNPSHVATDGNYTISYHQVEEKRIDRTTFEYIFEGDISTTGGLDTGVKAQVVSTNPATTIVDGFFMFPGADPAATTQSFDGFSIQQDRTVPFNPSDLVWTIAPMNLPPDPGPANDLTIEGIDSDSDGIRDDARRLIDLRYPESLDRRAALEQAARAMQVTLVGAGDPVSSQQHAAAEDNARRCLSAIWRTDGSINPSVFRSANAAYLDLQANMLDTPGRSSAFLTRDLHLAGLTFPGCWRSRETVEI